MQIKSFKGLRPLTIAAGFVLVDPAVARNIDLSQDIHICENINNVDLSHSFKNADSDSFDLSSKLKFDYYLSEWENNTMFLSSADQIIDDYNFKAIVAMGKAAVPFIKNEINNNPSTLVWALNLIYGKKISDNPHTNITDACKLWVKELRK